MNNQIREGNKQMKGPLEGVYILDMTMGHAGPVAVSMLADMGSEVITIEDNQGGG